MVGDSTAVGLGDPMADGTWRGVGPLVAGALGIAPDGYLNCSFTGARVRCVLRDQLPAALAHRADVALVVAGMNDTLRSDFDPHAVASDLHGVLAELVAVGTVPVAVRFHDHGRVFRLPAPLRRALRDRIAELNIAVDAAVRAAGVPCVDLDSLPGTYDLTSWSVDRLHPSELGHRLLARAFTERLRTVGFAVTAPVSLTCSGGATTTTVDHLGWLITRGVPWLWRRGRDLVPHAAGIMLRSAASRTRASLSASRLPRQAHDSAPTATGSATDGAAPAVGAPG
nr:SGNH/GDSL hydrolase family protein [Saccharomonospora amisosensis]